jgi:hypothetical protein
MTVSNQAMVSEVSGRTFAFRTRDLDPETGAAHRAVLSDQLVKGELTGAVLVQPDQPFTVRMPMRRPPIDPDIIWWKPIRPPDEPGEPPVPPWWLRRRERDWTIAPNASVTDADVFESPDGTVRYVLPRYALVTDLAGAVEEPRIVVADRDGTSTLVVTLVETPAPAAGPETREQPHAVSVTLRYALPVLGGGQVVQQLPFPTVHSGPEGTTVTAELPLTTPGLRQQLLAAFGSLAASPTLVVGRAAWLGVPVGQFFPDGEPAYQGQTIVLDWTVPPTPLILSDAQRARLGGGGGAVQPAIRHRIPFGGRKHSYWQDPARPERYCFVPDRFLLARSREGSRRPYLRVRTIEGAGAKANAVLEFHASPVVDPGRLEAALPALAEQARARGAPPDVRVELETVPEAQPLLRLALPRGGVPTGELTERPGAEIDLELGLWHAETLTLEDFRVVYGALFGSSLSMLRGEVRVGFGGGAPEDVPLELRLDRTDGALLAVEPGQVTVDRIPATVTNMIESSVRIDSLSAVAMVDKRLHRLRVEGVAPAQRLAPGTGCDVTLVPEAPLPSTAVEAVLLVESGLAVEPDRAIIWSLVRDPSTDVPISRTVDVHAVPELFTSPDRPGDKVIAFVVKIEHGDTVTLTEKALSATATVRLPVEPLLTGKPVPPLRYLTETWWQSGPIATSPWRATEAEDLLPVKTAPPAA